jgi:hypothetical protein
MKNKAKCLKCKSIVESFHRTDYCACTCGEISVYGGPDLMECSAMDWKSFVRVDDMGNEIQVKVTNPLTDSLSNESTFSKPTTMTKKDMIKMLDELIAVIDNLPQSAMNSPITHYDYQTLLVLLSSLFKSDLPEN